MTELATLPLPDAPTHNPRAAVLAIVRRSLTKARVLLNCMNEWNAELSVLYALDSPTQAQLERTLIVESALLEYDGYFRDGGSLPNGEYVKLARKKAGAA